MKRIAEFAISKKAFDVVMIDLRKFEAPTDFFLLCSADSETQVKAIADAIEDGTESIGVSSWQSEGYTALSWVLLDYVDVVVHIFHKEAREYYHLERLWKDAKVQSLVDSREGLKINSVKQKRPGTRKAKPFKKILT